MCIPSLCHMYTFTVSCVYLHCVTCIPSLCYVYTFAVSHVYLHCVTCIPSLCHMYTFTVSHVYLHCVTCIPSLCHMYTFTVSHVYLHCVTCIPSLCHMYTFTVSCVHPNLSHVHPPECWDCGSVQQVLSHFNSALSDEDGECGCHLANGSHLQLFSRLPPDVTLLCLLFHVLSCSLHSGKVLCPLLHWLERGRGQVRAGEELGFIYCMRIVIIHNVHEMYHF